MAPPQYSRQRNERVRLDRHPPSWKDMNGYSVGLEHAGQFPKSCWIVQNVLEDLDTDDEVETVILKRNSIWSRLCQEQVIAQISGDRLAVLPVASLRFTPKWEHVYAFSSQSLLAEFLHQITISAPEIQNTGRGRYRSTKIAGDA